MNPSGTIAVAAMSARLMAQAAVRDGFDVVALDLFGDADTRAVASRWMSVGNAATLTIDEGRTLDALRELARRADVDGWIAGSGFEGRVNLLDEASALLPLVGTAPQAVRRVRDPSTFFGFLAAKGIAHPPVRLGSLARTWPADGQPWLVKDATGCGGRQVRPAAHEGLDDMTDDHYLQQQVPGVPMSATFVANGRDAVVLGFNEMTVRRFGTRPFVFCGAVGPVVLASSAASLAEEAVRALAIEFDLRGLCSLDFMLDGDRMAVLEVNPRPPASMALYGDGLMAAHVRACREGVLPAPRGRASRIEGTEIVFARHAALIDDAAARRVGEWPGAHDLPRPGTQLSAGDPLCSLSASGNDGDAVRAALRRAREALLDTLETAR